MESVSSEPVKGTPRLVHATAATQARGEGDEAEKGQPGERLTGGIGLGAGQADGGWALKAALTGP